MPARIVCGVLFFGCGFHGDAKASLLAPRAIRNVTLSSLATGVERVVNHVRRMRMSKRARRKGYTVIDIGASGNAWSVRQGIVDAVADFDSESIFDCWLEEHLRGSYATDCCRLGSPPRCFNAEYPRLRCCRGTSPVPLLRRFEFDFVSAPSWQPLYEYVARYGKFDFAICSHVLEDVIDPRIIAEALPRVAKAGYVRVPSKFDELERGRERPFGHSVGPYRGSIHHRYIYTVRGGEMLAVPKLPFMDADVSYDSLSGIGRKDLAELNFYWEAALPFRILNDGYVGPSVESVVEQWRAHLGPDAFDDVSEVLSLRTERHNSCSPASGTECRLK